MAARAALHRGGGGSVSRVHSTLRRISAGVAGYAAASLSLVGVLIAGRLLVGLALRPLAGAAAVAPTELLPNALLGLALVWLALDTLERRVDAWIAKTKER